MVGVLMKLHFLWTIIQNIIVMPVFQVSMYKNTRFWALYRSSPWACMPSIKTFDDTDRPENRVCTVTLIDINTVGITQSVGHYCKHPVQAHRAATWTLKSQTKNDNWLVKSNFVIHIKHQQIFNPNSSGFQNCKTRSRTRGASMHVLILS